MLLHGRPNVLCCIIVYEGRSKSSRPDLVLFRIKLKYYLLLIVARLQMLTQMLTRMLTPNCTQFSEELLKRCRHDPAKFISQLVIQDETWIHNFDSESEQQSMQWNEQIGQNRDFTTLRKSVFCTSNANNRRPLKCTKYLCAKVILCMSCSKPCYFKKKILF